MAACAVCGGEIRVLLLLSEASHSRVFLADRGGERVALTELRFSSVPSAAVLEAFDRDAALLRQLSHPDVPPFVASFREGEGAETRLYLAQEYVGGGSLLDELLDHHFEEREAREIARHVLEILRHLHGLSVVHGDLTLANLVRRAEGRIALVGYGAERFAARARRDSGEPLGGRADPAADLYGLGASLIHLLGRRSPDALLHRGERLEFDEEARVSPEMCGFLGRLVGLGGARTFRTAGEALAALDVLEHRPRRAHRRAKFPGWIVLALMGLTAIPVVLAVQAVDPGPAPFRLERDLDLAVSEDVDLVARTGCEQTPGRFKLTHIRVEADGGVVRSTYEQLSILTVEGVLRMGDGDAACSTALVSVVLEGDRPYSPTLFLQGDAPEAPKSLRFPIPRTSRRVELVLRSVKTPVRFRIDLVAGKFERL